VLGRWWKGNGAGGLVLASATPALFIPIVGNVLVPLAGVPLGHVEWSAAQFGVGLLFWPVVMILIGVRIATSGLWPDRLRPTSFIFIAPPAVVGLSALQFGAPPLVGWALWGMAMFSWPGWPAGQGDRGTALRLPHWGLSFPLAALAALTLRLAGPGGPMATLGLLLLALASLVILALVLGTCAACATARCWRPNRWRRSSRWRRPDDAVASGDPVPGGSPMTTFRIPHAVALALAACALLAQAPAQAQSKKDTLVLAMQLEPTPGLDPTAGAASAIAEVSLYNIFETLTKVNSDSRITGLLADSWTVSPDLKVYTFKLRPGVKFHNGEPFNSAAVKFSFERAVTKESVNKDKAVFNNIASIDTPDATPWC
jgi:hypothetical protein